MFHAIWWDLWRWSLGPLSCVCGMQEVASWSLCLVRIEVSLLTFERALPVRVYRNQVSVYL